MIKIEPDERDFSRLAMVNKELVIPTEMQVKGGKFDEFIREMKDGIVPICKPKGSDKLDKIWSVLYNKQIRKSLRKEILPIQAELKSQIRRMVIDDLPIEIVFIGWPFKMRLNPLKTNRAYPDLGELAFIKRLMEIDISLRQVYSPGIRWKVLLEGKFYKSIFGVSDEDVNKYQSGMNFFLESLDYNIETIELEEVVRPYKKDIFEFTMDYVKHYTGRPFSNSQSRYIYYTTWWSLPITLLIPHLSLSRLLSIYYDHSPLMYSSSMQELRNIARNISLQYLGFNEAKNKVGNKGIIKDNFPDSIYASITNKIGRYSFYPIHRRTRYFPHHGVPVVRKNRNQIDIVYLSDLLSSNRRRFQAVYLDGDFEEKPFFYREL